MTISQRIFETLVAKNLKQSELAVFTGIKPQTISEWKSKGTNPTSEKISAIAEFLKVSIDYLLTGEEAQEKSLPSLSEDKRRLYEYIDLLTHDERMELVGELKERTKRKTGDLT